MSSGIVDQITLECLMNKDLYHKLVTNKTRAQDKKTDYKFYRKRILALTKELIADEVQTDLMQDVEYAFHNYVKTCIRHFKITDEYGENHQTEGIDEPGINEQGVNEPVGETKEEVSKDALMLKSIKFPSGTLDGFINYHTSPNTATATATTATTTTAITIATNDHE
jgi:hypothetical protein